MPDYLRSIDPSDEPVHNTVNPNLPKFEGQDVSFTRLKVTACSDLELEEEKPLHIDDIVKLYVEGRVTRVDHVVDDKSGQLKRVHTIKVVEAHEVSWNFTDKL